MWESFRTFVFLNLFSAQKLSVDWLKTNCDNTLVSSVCPDSCSPLTLPSAAVKQERESKQVRAKLRLIEEVNILQDDTAGKRTVSV